MYEIYNFTEQGQLNKDGYYNFKIILNTPYKRGTIYEGSTEEEVTQNFFNFNTIFESLGKKWKATYDNGAFGTPTWYNTDDAMEEIYAHPAELTGTMKYENIMKLANFIENSNFEVTKIQDLRFFNETKKYSNKEIYDKFNSNLSTFLHSPRARGGCVAMNYDFKEFGLNFKACCFANIYYNKQLEAIKTFLIDIINEKLKEMR